MPLDELLDGTEMRVLLVNKASLVLHRTFAETPLTRIELIQTIERMLRIAESLPPDVKQ